MNEIIASPLFSIFLCIIAYKIGLLIQQKTKLAVANPLLIAILIVIVFLSAAGISLDQFNQGASFISMFLTPATCMLALSIYRQADKLKKNLIPILAGTLVGSIVSMTSVMLLCNVFQLDGSNGLFADSQISNHSHCHGRQCFLGGIRTDHHCRCDYNRHNWGCFSAYPN